MFVQSPLKLDGKLQEVDVASDLVLNDEEIHITGTKTFTGPTVITNLTSKNYLAALDFHNLCNFASQNNLGSLKVTGG